MPSTGNPMDNIPVSQSGAPASYTEFGPPERTIPAGSYLRICSIPAVQGRIALNTCCSRIRRAINCVYCPPKSNTTMPPRSLMISSTSPHLGLPGEPYSWITPRPGSPVCPAQLLSLLRAGRSEVAQSWDRQEHASLDSLCPAPPRRRVYLLHAHSSAPRFR